MKIRFIASVCALSLFFVLPARADIGPIEPGQKGISQYYFEQQEKQRAELAASERRVKNKAAASVAFVYGPLVLLPLLAMWGWWRLYRNKHDDSRMTTTLSER